jgi:uncharacterized protein YndB with AHSA1/START domain
VTSSTSVSQEIDLNAPPARVYQALTVSKEHAAFTGATSEIDASEGGAFRCHDGQIVGWNLELVEDARIVQAWRVAAWPAGVFSVVKYELTANDVGGTHVSLSHTGLPEGANAMIADGWEQRYWKPLAAYLA